MKNKCKYLQKLQEAHMRIWILKQSSLKSVINSIPKLFQNSINTDVFDNEGLSISSLYDDKEIYEQR
jgi:hypothetical protein